VLRCSWLGGWKGIWPVKKLSAGMVICMLYADLHTVQLIPLPLTVSCFSEVQIGFTFLVPDYPGSPGKRLLNGCVSACVLGRASQFAIRIDSIRYANQFYSLCESIRFVKKSAFRFTSCHAVFLAYLKAILCITSTKNSYSMHTIKITPNLLLEYQCTSGKFIRLPNQIE